MTTILFSMLSNILTFSNLKTILSEKFCLTKMKITKLSNPPKREISIS